LAAALIVANIAADMTYCVSLKVDAGMVFASDSRTNAGFDQISTFWSSPDTVDSQAMQLVG